jgi:7-cyano-7-deazaguanine synthase
MIKDTVCIYSGGMDSFTLVNELHEHNRVHSCLSFNYGQRHSKELGYAQRVCQTLGIPHHLVDLAALGSLFKSALTDGSPVPEGHYSEESMKLTVVPNRNMMMLSVAAGYAISQRCKFVAFGAHGGDHAIYPDCRLEFIQLMNQTIASGNWDEVTIIAPYLHWNKTLILREGFRMGLDYRNSWTCYKGGERACGKCGSCQERLEAFARHGRSDPLEYDHD